MEFYTSGSSSGIPLAQSGHSAGVTDFIGNQWAAYGLNLVRRKPGRNLRSQPPNRFWPQTQQLEVEPSVAVVTRLQEEVTSPC